MRETVKERRRFQRLGVIGRDQRVRRQTEPPSADIPEAQAGRVSLRRDTYYRRSLAAVDITACALALFFVPVVSGATRPQLAVLALLPLVVLFAKTIGLYDRDEHLLRKTTLDEAPKLWHVSTVVTLLAAVNQDFMFTHGLQRTSILFIWAAMFLALVLGRALVRRLVGRVTSPERCLVIADAETALRLRKTFADCLGSNAQIVGRMAFGTDDRPPRRSGEADVPILGHTEAIGLALAEHDIDRVVIAPPTSVDGEELLHVIRLVKAIGAKVTVLPRLFEVVGSSVEFDDVNGVTLLGLRRHGLTVSSLFLKRALDVAVSVTMLVILAPFLAMIAIAIKLDASGPVFFRQRRIGMKNRDFEILKFRTMCCDAEAQKADLRGDNEAVGLFKIQNDPRITRVGGFLRRTSLDELPQLFNVLRGQMSLVGPRPLVPDEDAQVEGWHRRRLLVKPGMTGLWQIFGSSRIPLPEMVKIDYLYGANWSLWLDLKVLLRTVPYVLSRRGM